MHDIDPREGLHYDGPELDGLSGDAKYDLQKQLRIMARNKRIGAALYERRLRHEKTFAWWAVGLSVAFILGGLAFTVTFLEHLHARHP